MDTKTLIGGDGLSASIAAASILAKVTRDRMCLEWDALYPLYGIAAHKGYATKAHTEALKLYGPSPIHRKSFLSKILKGTAFEL
jgi:ribonuclease HII